MGMKAKVLVYSLYRMVDIKIITMLPFALVLLLASSALAAPSVLINQASINEIPPLSDPGGGVNRAVTDRAFELVDSGDSGVYTLTIQQILNDLASQPDAYSRAAAIAQTIAVLGELSSGVAGDACSASSIIDLYANGRLSQAAVRNYLSSLANSIDNINAVAINPNSRRLSRGQVGNCAGAGRTYNFEAAWDGILAQASPATLPLVNEEYCAARRLYKAFGARSNNVGAQVTASSIPAVVNRVQRAVGPITNFLRVAANGGNSSAAAAAAKKALLA